MNRVRARRRRGMSLVEVMVVIAIILTLMSVIGIGVWRTFNNSRVETTKLAMSQVNQQVEIHLLRKKKAPENLGEVFDGEEVPKDAWGNDFVYITPGPDGKPYELISLGSDGEEGGTGNAEDIKWSESGRQ